MIKNIVLALMLASLSLGVQIQNAVGPEVELTLFNGAEYTGEILSVRANEIVFTTRHGIQEEALAERKQWIVLPQDSIQQIVLPGSSKVLMGMGIGVGVGCLSGCLIGGSEAKSKGQGCNREAEEGLEFFGRAVYGAIGGAVGLALGGVIGASVSDKDAVLIDSNSRDFSGLRSLARYKGAEPEFLRNMK